jgi:lysozyme
MKVSDKGLLEICEHEGIVPTVYYDSVRVKTFGVGHTAAAGAPDPAFMPMLMPKGEDLDDAIDRAIKLFGTDVEKYAARVRKAIKAPLKQHQFDALVAWDFNTGGALWRSPSGKPCQLIQQVNAGNFSGDGFMGWLRPPELRKRRTAEQRLFQTGDYDHNGTTIPVWGTNGAGRLKGIVKNMDGHEVLKKMWPGYTPKPTKRTLLDIIADIFAAFLKKG